LEKVEDQREQPSEGWGWQSKQQTVLKRKSWGGMGKRGEKKGDAAGGANIGRPASIGMRPKIA